MLLISINVIFKYFYKILFVSSPAILHPPVLCTSKQEPGGGPQEYNVYTVHMTTEMQKRAVFGEWMWIAISLFKTYV